MRIKQDTKKKAPRCFVFVAQSLSPHCVLQTSSCHHGDSLFESLHQTHPECIAHTMSNRRHSSKGQSEVQRWLLRATRSSRFCSEKNFLGSPAFQKFNFLPSKFHDSKLSLETWAQVSYSKLSLETSKMVTCQKKTGNFMKFHEKTEVSLTICRA